MKLKKPIDSCMRNFRQGLFPTLFAGKLIGAIPFTFSSILNFRGNFDRPFKFQYVSLACFVTLSIILVQLVFVLATFWDEIVAIRAAPSISANAILYAIIMPTFTFVAFFLYSYFLWNASRFREVIENFHSTCNQLTCSNLENHWFSKLGLLLLVFFLGTCVVENLLFDVQRFTYQDLVGKSVLQKYYIHDGAYLVKIIPFHSGLAITAAFIKKIMTYVTVISDVLVMLLCQALTVLFQGVNRYVDQQLTLRTSPIAQVVNEEISKKIEQLEGGNILPKSPLSNNPESNKPKVFAAMPWENIRDDVLNVCKLTKVVSAFVSPLIHACIGFNTTCVAWQMFSWLNPNPSTTSVERSLYVYVSNFSFGLRVILVIYFAANVYHSTDEIKRTVQQAPAKQFNKMSERLERLLEGHPAGICLFNTFCITRRFFVSIISFICTVEIVLLQTENGNKSIMK